MKFTYGWLKDYLDTDATVQNICESLTSIGLEVEKVEDPAVIYGGFLVAEIEVAEKHPNADRLQLCTVSTGKNKFQVVCGAPNARAGLKGVFAPAGTFIPGLGQTLQKGRIRGVESEGMMLSMKELDLSDEHEGILELPADAPVGVSYADYAGLDDPVIEIALTPNRADCACVWGIARDLAAAGAGILKNPEVPEIKSIKSSRVNVEINFSGRDESNSCPIFIGRSITGVRNTQAPAWMRKRLEAVGIRSISALVDITNYITLSINRPLHVYDQAKLKGNIHVRFARKGESFQALNGKQYELQGGEVAICDESGVIGLGGIMGGESTAVDENTCDVFLESACFDTVNIARTGRDLQITSDARYRFERGIDAAFVFDGEAIAASMIQDICGGEACSLVQAGDLSIHEQKVRYMPSSCAKLTGVEVPIVRQKEILLSLGFNISKEEGQTWTLSVPSWRMDIDGSADIVEEVSRIYGYDNIPAVGLGRKSDPAAAATRTVNKEFALAVIATKTLAGRGYKEAVTWSFMSSEKADMFGANDYQNAKALRILNPISSELDQMRPSLLPNLVEAADKNAARGYENTMLFEVGPAFKGTHPEEQILVAAGVRAGFVGERHWSGPHAYRKTDAYDAKADVTAVLDACGFEASRVPLTRDAPSFFHPGQSGSFRIGTTVLANFGMIHPGILDEYGITFPVSAFEIFLQRIPLPKKKSASKLSLDLPELQRVRRDFSFIVSRDVEADELVRAAVATDKKLIQSAKVFDVYTGQGIGEQEKSLALEIVLQPREHTLVEKDLDTLSRKLIENVGRKTGARLRT